MTDPQTSSSPGSARKRLCVCADQPGGCDPWCIACANQVVCLALTVVVNPEAIGDPSETPVVRVGAGLRALLRPCRCGGVNGFHTESCDA